jgi:hypothetical protein
MRLLDGSWARSLSTLLLCLEPASTIRRSFPSHRDRRDHSFLGVDFSCATASVAFRF